ncbi:Protein of unknown function [Gryllus bimaculatus]|nr:Protein of unknown function [Gryllus bimaculatus]
MFQFVRNRKPPFRLYTVTGAVIDSPSAARRWCTSARPRTWWGSCWRPIARRGRRILSRTSPGFSTGTW